jgi:hypothetical protein
MNLRFLALLALSALSPQASSQEVRTPATVSTIEETKKADFSA